MKLASAIHPNCRSSARLWRTHHRIGCFRSFWPKTGGAANEDIVDILRDCQIDRC